MINAATRAMNVSSHTLGDLRTFVQADPNEAQAYLQSVKQNLVSGGRQVPAAIEAILNGPANELDQRITNNAAALAPYFPDQPQMWAQLQAQRAQTIGWTAGTLPVQHAVTGKLDATGMTLTTAAGATYNLATASRTATSMPVGWLTGFRQDGEAPITVRGTIGADGKTFLVEDYSPGSSSDFTFGRLDQTNPSVINTARGPVRVTDPTFLAKMQRLPRLGVILPGSPVQQGNELVYTGNPDKYYALGRFGSFPGAGGLQAAVTNAQAQVTMYQQQIQAYQTTLTQLQQQLTSTLQVPAPATPAETGAFQALQAAEQQVNAATAGVASAYNVLLQAQTAATAAGNTPAALQQVTDAQTAYNTATQQSATAFGALNTATQTAIGANAAYANTLTQRASVLQQINSYQQAIAPQQGQLDTAQQALATAQAALNAAQTPQPAANAVITGATGDFAWSTFSRKPINIHGAQEATRANHTDRMWALGSFTFDAQGVPATFEAEYLSLPLGGGQLGASVQEADDWLAALATTEAGVGTPSTTPMGADFVRHTP